MKRNFRKPLVLMTPKSLLRHKLAVSSLEEMAAGARGSSTVSARPTPIAAPEQVQRVVLCSGKVYYDLLARRRERGIDDVALLRCEQLYPFPSSLPGAGALPQRRDGVVPGGAVEHGGLAFMDRRTEAVLGALGGTAKRLRYVGRHAASSPATGLARTHAAEQVAPGKRRPCTRLICHRMTTRQDWTRLPWPTEIKVPSLGESVTSATSRAG